MIPPIYTLSLFGHAAISGPKGPLTGRIVQKRRLALLAMLASAGEAGVSRERLIALFWPDHDDAQARRLVADALYVLRRELQKDAILTHGDTVRLNPAIVASDVEQVRTALAEADADALAHCYGGPFFADVHMPGAPEFMLWLDAERSRWTRQVSTALFEVAAQRMQAEAPARAQPLLEALLRADPHHTAGALLLADVLAQGDQRAAALRLLQEHRQRLIEDLDATADPALDDAIVHLQTRPPVTSKPTLPPPPSPLGTSSASALPRKHSVVLRYALIAVLVLVPIVAFLLTRPAPADATPEIVVVPFANATNDATFDAILSMSTDWLLHGLRDLPTVTPLGAETNEQHANLTLTEVLAEWQPSEADALIWGQLAWASDSSTVLNVYVVDLTNGRTLHTATLACEPDEPLSLAEVLRAEVGGAVATLYDLRLSEWARGTESLPNLSTYQAYVEARDVAEDEGDWGKAVPLFEAIVARDSSFFAAQLYLALGYRSMRQWDQARAVAERLERWPTPLTVIEETNADWTIALARQQVPQMLDAARRRLALTPQYEFSQWMFIIAAMRNGQPDEAWPLIENLSTTESSYALSPTFASFRSRAQYARGDDLGALDTAEQFLAKLPSFFALQADQIRALAALDRPTDLQRIVQALFADASAPLEWESLQLGMLAGVELQMHGYDAEAQALWQHLASIPPATEHTVAYAEVLYLLRRWDDARRHLGNLASTDPMRIGLGGLIAFQQGDAAAGQQAYEALQPHVETATLPRTIALLRARLAAQLDRPEDALRHIQDGFTREGIVYDIGPHNHPDYHALWSLPAFHTLTRGIRATYQMR
ncbi:MAG: hypothetical protein RhofKO_22280 [Rhodothermales bacterium]